MAKSTPNTIVREWPQRTGPSHQEALAAAAIGPGELVDKDGSGDLILNADSAGTVPVKKMVAIESPTADTSSANSAIDQDYDSGDTVRYVIPAPGSRLYMYLSSGENVSEGDPLTSDGAGALEAITLTGTTGVDQAIVCYADEDVNASTGRSRIHVRFQ